ncbi:hypothetical protein [Tessaracoccus palaemonis]|uniref:Fibronectin type-III domain-containing protein n=1 Tax=Tessaracoccus palaemonis TaxID=2829499 RepID=A0ABX8SK04_9ACTN|nr:hypothetical protein [Tessaracoccus palaemonis]QXT62760.1 hypothetical protein KDB89_13655 [Tessaracoccus palaemonis]
MATATGSWAGSGNRRMRLIVTYSLSSTDSKTTVDISSLKVEAVYGFSDSDNTLTRSGSLFDGGEGAVDIDVSSGGTQTLWSGSKTVDRGSSDQKLTMAWSLSGIDYVGATATVSATVTIPAVPAPDAPTSVGIARESISSVKLTWGGGDVHHIQARRRATAGDATSSWGSWGDVSTSTQSSGGVWSSAFDTGYDWQIRVRRRNSAGVYSSWTTSSNSARLYDAPSAPTSASVTRTNDASHKVAFAGATATSKPLRWVDVQIYGGVSQEWRDQATSLAASTRSYTSTTNIADNTGRWRIRFRNSAGSSAWVYTSTAYGTPKATSKPAAKRSGTSNVIVSWTNNARFAVGLDVRAASSTDGGTTWSSYAAITGHTGLSASTTSRTITGLDASRLWKFETRVYVTSPSTLSVYSGGGNVLQLLSAPSAPTLLTPLSTISDQDRTRFSWRHNPIDGSDQEAAEVRYRVDGAAWTTQQTGVSDYFDTLEPLAAGALEWQARTRGSHADYSPWSGVASLLVASPPAVTILDPVDGATLASNRLVLTIGWDDAQDAAMIRRTRRLRDEAGEILEEVTTSGATDTITFTTRLADGGSYTAEVEATSGTGLTSGVASIALTVDYIDPVAPILTAAWVEASGLAVLGVVNTPGDMGADPPTADTASNRIERSTDSGLTWATVVDGLEPDGGATDTMVPLNTRVTYRAVAVSAMGAETIGDSIDVTTTSHLLWIAGPGGDVAIEWNLGLQADHGQEVVLEQYYRRPKPTSHYGDGRPFSLQISAVLAEGHRDTFIPDHLLGDDVFCRDPEGHAFWAAVTSGPSLNSSTTREATVSMTLEAVDA